MITSLDSNITRSDSDMVKLHSTAENDIIDSEVCHSECLGGCSGPGPDHCITCQHFSLMR